MYILESCFAYLATHNSKKNLRFLFSYIMSSKNRTSAACTVCIVCAVCTVCPERWSGDLFLPAPFLFLCVCVCYSFICLQLCKSQFIFLMNFPHLIKVAQRRICTTPQASFTAVALISDWSTWAVVHTGSALVPVMDQQEIVADCRRQPAVSLL